MGKPLDISQVVFVPAGESDRRTGLLGYVSCVVNGALHLDGITVRTTAGGRLGLSFPERRNSRGDRFPYMRPVDRGARAEVERAIISAIGLHNVTGPRP